MLSSRKRFYVIKHTYSVRLRVCVSMYDLLSPPGNKELHEIILNCMDVKTLPVGKSFLVEKFSDQEKLFASGKPP